jgi:hypothetical protein
MPYDLLIEALKVCKHWDDDEEEWRDGDPFVYLEVIHGQNASAMAPPPQRLPSMKDVPGG